MAPSLRTPICRHSRLLESGWSGGLGDPPQDTGTHSHHIYLYELTSSLLAPLLPPSSPSLQPSATSGFYILHDWQNTYSGDSSLPLPALSVSDVMLKTMGILRVCLLCASLVSCRVLTACLRSRREQGGQVCRWAASSADLMPQPCS